MGVPSDGSYGIPEDIVYGVPVTTANGEYTRVRDLPNWNRRLLALCLDGRVLAVVDRVGGAHRRGALAQLRPELRDARRGVAVADRAVACGVTSRPTAPLRDARY